MVAYYLIKVVECIVVAYIIDFIMDGEAETSKGIYLTITLMALFVLSSFVDYHN